MLIEPCAIERYEERVRRHGPFEFGEDVIEHRGRDRLQKLKQGNDGLAGTGNPYFVEMWFP